MDAIRISRNDAHFEQFNYFSRIRTPARLCSKPYWKALELRLVKLGLPSIIPYLMRPTDNGSAPYEDGKDFYLEANDAEGPRAWSLPIKLLRSRYKDPSV
jgi:hypothetical protein